MDSIVSACSSKDLTCSREDLQAIKEDPAVLAVHSKVDQRRSTPSPAASVKSVATQVSSDEVDDVEHKKNVPEVEEASRFEDTVRLQNATVLSLAPLQLDLLLQYAGVLRLQRNLHRDHLYTECAFCKKNGERSEWYSSHVLKDSCGRVRCPVLRVYHCPACGATGDRAHTIKYCPENRYGDRWSR